MRFFIALLLLAASCGESMSPTPPPPRPALAALLTEKKFEPNDYYTGVDEPDDLAPLENAVNSAINDVAAMPEPLEMDAVRQRLKTIIDDVDMFATEDRDQAYRYAIRIWRAAGFKDESGLFAVPDDRVMDPFG